MLRFKTPILIFLSGLPFFLVGFMMIKKGLSFIGEAARLAPFLPSKVFPLVNPLSLIRDEEGIIVLTIVFLGLVLGLVKGRKVIVPSVQGNLKRLLALPSPAPITSLYDRKGWIVLGVMMSLGMALNVLPVPIDLRGLIDLTVGVALLQGGMTSLRAFKSLKMREL